MELALNLGFRTIEQLDREMSVEEFLLWGQYASKHLLPIRRTEYYLAQIASQVSNVYHALGGRAYSLKDFLMDTLIEQATRKDNAETGAEVIGAMTGGIRVVHIGQKRKKANGRVAR